MAMVDVPIPLFQIVGFQNSGKTTLMTKVITKLHEDGLTVATIKHHGHGGKPSFNGNKDSAQHVQAGAKATIVEGGGTLLLHGEKDSWSLGDQIRLLLTIQPDVILVEGHKKVPFPKGVIIRKRDDLKLIDELKQIKVIFYWDIQLLTEIAISGIKTFHIDDLNGVQWIIDYLKNQ